MSTMGQSPRTVGGETDIKATATEHAAVLKDDLQTLKTDAVEAGSEIAQDIKETAVAAKDAVVDTATEYGDQTAEYHAMMCRNVRKHPTAAVLLSLGAGIVLGRLLGGR